MQGNQGTYNHVNESINSLFPSGSSPAQLPQSSSKYLVKQLSLDLNLVDIEKDGDQFEIDNFNLIKKNFPNYEIFWKKFIVPITRRIDPIYENMPQNQRIQFRESVDPDFIELSVAHYSIFVSLVKAIKLKSTDYREYYEEFYFRLGNVNENTLRLITICWVIFERIVKNNTTIDRSKELELLDGKKDTLLNKIWKSIPLELEYKNYESENPNIMPTRKINGIKKINYRNLVTHNPKIAELKDKSGRYLIPKPESLQSFKDWSATMAITNNLTILNNFVPMEEQMASDLNALQKSLNILWKSLILNMEQIFESNLYYELLNLEK